MVFVVPMAASDTTYFQTETTHFTQADNVEFAAHAPPLAVANVAVTGGVTVMQGGAFALDEQETVAALFGFDRSTIVPNRVPRITIRDHYAHHDAMRTDVVNQLEGQGFRVSRGEASFGNSCGTGRCRPDIIYRTPDGQVRIIEIKTGNADLSIRQTEIYPQIENGNAIPRGKVAERFGLEPGIPLKDQGYPNGIPIEIKTFPGAG